jgi:L-aspartate oxidase
MPEKIETDVLVIGGGLAGSWAATAAARAGAEVVIAEKGYCGTSGVTALAGPGHWWVPPDASLRAKAVARRIDSGLGLADPRWMERVLDTTWRTLPSVAPHYDFPRDDSGSIRYREMRGPEYMRAMREVALEAGATILDHTPALTLLRHADGSIAGALLYSRSGGEQVAVRAGAVVLATGGVAFRSRMLGAGNLTGDGLLMAAEAGAELSGMEFTGYCTVAPAGTNMTRSMSYAFANYFDQGGQAIAVRPGQDGMRDIGAALLRGPVYCSLARMPEDIRGMITRISPNVSLVFDRLGIDPYRDRFEIDLHPEGTVRGTGGVVLAGEDCRTEVDGLYVAGDTATREEVAGATSGGGNQNSAWALSSGVWAGRAAFERALALGRRAGEPAEAAGQHGLGSPGVSGVEAGEVDRVIRGEMLAHDANLFRSEAGLRRALGVLDEVWQQVRGGVAGADPLRARESAALVASARWSWNSALRRRESRGLHQRSDAPQTDPAQARRLIVSGLDEVTVRPGVTAHAAEQAA